MSAEAEISAFKDFRERCSEQGLLKHPYGIGESDALDGLTDNLTLRRFLRADKLDVQKALARYQAACSTRERTKLCEVYEKIEISEFEKARTLYPHWSGRRDKQGLPILIFDISCLTPSVLAEYKAARAVHSSNVTDATIRALVVHEFLTRFILPLCAEIAVGEGKDGAVVSCLYLIDVSSISIKQAWNLRNYAQDISKLLANDYAEIVNKALVVGAPSYFSTVWSIVKGYVDPATAAKIEILNSANTGAILRDRIEEENIPKQFGGTLDFRHGMQPMLDNRARTALDAAMSSAPVTIEGPYKWVLDENNQRRAVAVGSVRDQPRSQSSSVEARPAKHDSSALSNVHAISVTA